MASSPLEQIVAQTLKHDDPFYAVQQALAYAGISVGTRAEIQSWFVQNVQASIRSGPGWKSHLTWNGSPIEPSMNICGLPSPDSRLVEKTVRFGIEPVGPYAGSSSDPFNQKAILSLVEKLKTCMPQLDSTLFHHLQDHFFVPETRENVLKAANHGPPSSTCYIAFDLSEKGISSIGTKIYFVLARASAISGKNPAHMIEDAILDIDKATGSTFGVPFRTVLSYIDSPGSVLEMNDIEGLGIEPKALSASPRLKIYAHTHKYTFDAVEHALTLGGRMSNTSLPLLWELWQLLFSDKLAAVPIEERAHHTIQTDHNLHDRDPDFMFSFEIRSGHVSPDIKFYLPLQYYNVSDAENARRLSAFFLARGWTEMADSYEQQLKMILPLNDIDNRAGSHTYLSFAMVKERPYMTLYWQPDGLKLPGQKFEVDEPESPPQEESKVVEKSSWLKRYMRRLLCY